MSRLVHTFTYPYVDEKGNLQDVEVRTYTNPAGGGPVRPKSSFPPNVTELILTSYYIELSARVPVVIPYRYRVEQTARNPETNGPVRNPSRRPTRGENIYDNPDFINKTIVTELQIARFTLRVDFSFYNLKIYSTPKAWSQRTNFEVITPDVPITDPVVREPTAKNALYVHESDTPYYRFNYQPDGLKTSLRNKIKRPNKIEILGVTQKSRPTIINNMLLPRHVFEWELKEQDLFRPIWSMACTLNFRVEEEGQYRELFEPEDGAYTLHYSEDNQTMFELFSVGTLYYERYKRIPYQASLDFSDGTAILQQTMFSMVASSYRVTDYEIIKSILQSVGNTLPLAENTAIYDEQKLIKPSERPIRHMESDIRMFDGLTNYEALSSIAKSHGAVLRQAHLPNVGACWMLVDYQAYKNAPIRFFYIHNTENDVISKQIDADLSQVSGVSTPSKSRYLLINTDVVRKETQPTYNQINIVEGSLSIPEFLPEGEFGGGAWAFNLEKYQGTIFEDINFEEPDGSRNFSYFRELQYWTFNAPAVYRRATDTDSTYYIACEWNLAHPRRNNPVYLNYMESAPFDVVQSGEGVDENVIEFSFGFSLNSITARQLRNIPGNLLPAIPLQFVLTYRDENDEEQTLYLGAGTEFSTEPSFLLAEYWKSLDAPTDSPPIMKFVTPRYKIPHNGQLQVRIFQTLQGYNPSGAQPPIMGVTGIHYVRAKYFTRNDFQAGQRKIVATFPNTTGDNTRQVVKPRDLQVDYVSVDDPGLINTKTAKGKVISLFRDRSAAKYNDQPVGTLSEVLAAKVLRTYGALRQGLQGFDVMDEHGTFATHRPFYLFDDPDTWYVPVNITFLPQDENRRRVLRIDAQQIIDRPAAISFTEEEQKSSSPERPSSRGGDFFSTVSDEERQAAEEFDLLQFMEDFVGDGVEIAVKNGKLRANATDSNNDPSTLQEVTEQGNTTTLPVTVENTVEADEYVVGDSYLRSNELFSRQLDINTLFDVFINNGLQINSAGQVFFSQRTGQAVAVAGFTNLGRPVTFQLPDYINIVNGELRITFPDVNGGVTDYNDLTNKPITNESFSVKRVRGRLVIDDQNSTSGGTLLVIENDEVKRTSQLFATQDYALQQAINSEINAIATARAYTDQEIAAINIIKAGGSNLSQVDFPVTSTYQTIFSDNVGTGASFVHIDGFISSSINWQVNIAVFVGGVQQANTGFIDENGPHINYQANIYHPNTSGSLLVRIVGTSGVTFQRLRAHIINIK